MLMQEWLGPMGVVLLGYTVLGLTGFGSALVIVPLLAWHWPSRVFGWTTAWRTGSRWHGCARSFAACWWSAG